jgi:hypothetical protein
MTPAGAIAQPCTSRVARAAPNLCMAGCETQCAAMLSPMDHGPTQVNDSQQAIPHATLKNAGEVSSARFSTLGNDMNLLKLFRAGKINTTPYTERKWREAQYIWANAYPTKPKIWFSEGYWFCARSPQQTFAVGRSRTIRGAYMDWRSICGIDQYADALRYDLAAKYSPQEYDDVLRTLGLMP